MQDVAYCHGGTPVIDLLTADSAIAIPNRCLYQAIMRTESSAHVHCFVSTRPSHKPGGSLCCMTLLARVTNHLKRWTSTRSSVKQAAIYRRTKLASRLQEVRQGAVIDHPPRHHIVAVRQLPSGSLHDAGLVRYPTRWCSMIDPRAVPRLLKPESVEPNPLLYSCLPGFVLF